jgi:Icc-related predicted phosphoesterase
MHRLKTDRATIDSGKSAISAIGKYKNDSVSLAFMLRDLGVETAKLAVECEMILGLCDHRKMELLSATEISGVPYKLSMLNIDGSDLLSMGFSGFEIGKTLAQLQEKVILGELKNEKDLLKNEALKQKSSLTEI